MTHTTEKNPYGLEACMETITFEVESLHEDPIRLLGEMTLRARQDKWFNTGMIDAMNIYIDQHSINWSDR